MADNNQRVAPSIVPGLSTKTAEAWQRWVGVHAIRRPPRTRETDLGVAGAIGGPDIRVVQRPG